MPDKLLPDYNSESQKVITYKRRMTAKIKKLIKELDADSENDLLLIGTSHLEEYGKLIKKAHEYRESVRPKGKEF